MIQGRYDETCRVYREHLQSLIAICRTYSKEMNRQSKAPPLPEESNGLEAMKKVDASYRRTACAYSVLGRISNDIKSRSFNTWKKLDPNQRGLPADATMVDLKKGLTDEVTRVQELARNKAAAAIQANKLSSQGSSKLQASMAACQTVSQEVLDFDFRYQSNVAAEFKRIHFDADRAEKFFIDKEMKFRKLHYDLSDRIEILGAGKTSPESTKGLDSPIRVKGTAAYPSIEMCASEEELSSVEKNVRESTFKASGTDNSFGTGFIAKTTGPDGKPIYHNVTAEHVALDDKNKVMPLWKKGDGSEKNNGDLLFSESSSEMDSKNDVAIQKGGYGPGLPVQSGQNVPKEGQEFIMAGHPGNIYDGQYVNMSCRFLGYGTGTSAGYYVLDCPTSNTHMGGLSGGPMVDPNTGAVWGVASKQDSTIDSNDFVQYNNNRVIVSPIQQAKDGRILTGPQNNVQGNCYDAGVAFPLPCHVSPNGVSFD